MNEKISVIVPIYNTQKYLKKCIDSVINQTYTNLEIILIDDGSTDYSKKICEEYTKKDERVIFISKKNSGVSDTRNLGIEKATGIYIGFVDSDDYIEKNMFEILYKNIIEYEADLSVCEKKGKNIKSRNIYTMDKNDFSKFMLENYGPGGFLWNKLYKKSIIQENNIKLNKNIYICEDLLFNCIYLEKVNKVVYTNKELYNYNNIENSAINKKFNNKSFTIIDAYNKIEKIYEKKNDEIFDYFKVSYTLANINIKTKMYLAGVKNQKFLEICNNNISKYLKQVFKSKNINLKMKTKVFCYYYFHRIINLLKKICGRK